MNVATGRQHQVERAVAVLDAAAVLVVGVSRRTPLVHRLVVVAEVVLETVAAVRQRVEIGRIYTHIWKKHTHKTTNIIYIWTHM